MARGIMYHITENPKNVNAMSEIDFYENIEFLSVDYVQDRTVEESKEDIALLAERLKAAGFSIEEYVPLDEKGNSMGNYPVIKTGNKENTESCIMQYFAATYEKFKKQVQEMSLRTFALDALEASALRLLINDTYDDAVYYGDNYESIYTMDDFVRRMTPETTYYIAPETIFMH